MKLPVATAVVFCLFTGPAWSQYMTGERTRGVNAPTQFQIRSALRMGAVTRQSPTRPSLTPAGRINEESIWVIGCKLMINYTDTIETSEKMQRDLDDALSGEPCLRAAAEINLADRLKFIRDRIRELREDEQG